MSNLLSDLCLYPQKNTNNFAAPNYSKNLNNMDLRLKNTKTCSWCLMFLFMLLPSVSLAQNTRRVTGTVVDETGEALIGVTVTEPGGANGAITDLDGNFSLDLSTGTNSIQVSYQLHIVQLLNKRKAIEQNTRIEGMVSVQSQDSVASNDEELMERVISLIDSNMQSEEFNVTKLCSLLCMDQKQLYRKLKQLTGETPVSFIRKQRMERAAALLKQERFTVSEVMYQVGFSSASYFSKSFIKEFGVSPKDFANH